MGRQFANRDVSDLAIYTINSDGTTTPYAFIDYANVTAVDMTGEVVYAYGGQGHPKKVTFTGDRGGTLRVESQIGDGLLYSMLTGASVETSATILKRVPVTTTGKNTFSIGNDYVADSKITVFAASDDLGVPYPGTCSVDGTTVTYIPGDGDPDIAVNTNLVVYYTASISDVVKFNLKSTTFPKAVKICGKTYDKDENDHIVNQYMVAYKAVPQPNFTVSSQNTGDPGTITITYDLLEDSSGNILDLIFEDEQ